MILKHIKTDKPAGEKEKDYIKAIFKGHYMAAHPNFPAGNELIKEVVDARLESLEEKIEQLEDKKLHENEFGFDMLCEKYVDDCAMKFATVIIEQSFLDNAEKMTHSDIAELAYDLAEDMLEEKLKRNSKQKKRKQH